MSENKDRIATPLISKPLSPSVTVQAMQAEAKEKTNNELNKMGIYKDISVLHVHLLELL